MRERLLNKAAVAMRQNRINAHCTGCRQHDCDDRRNDCHQQSGLFKHQNQQAQMRCHQTPKGQESEQKVDWHHRQQRGKDRRDQDIGDQLHTRQFANRDTIDQLRNQMRVDFNTSSRHSSLHQ